MWGLDRFSGQQPSSQTPPPRNYSPLPRRPTQPTRPNLSPRGSSTLSLGSTNNSTSSLPGTAIKGTSGSGLKNQIYAPLPEEIEDPLKALERVVGAALDILGRDDTSKDAHSSIDSKPDILIEDIDFKGLSLVDFAAQGSSRPGDGSSKESSLYISQSVEEYEKERGRFEDLHKSIYACDDVLHSVEKYLTSFRSDLSAVSAEIESLQSRSTALNDKLETRKEVEAMLSPVVDEITIPSRVVRKISEEPIDAAWAAALEELQARSRALEEAGSDSEPVKANEELGPLIQQLSGRAVERIRDHLAAQIRSLRSPNINAQIIQKQAFLPYKALFAFLAEKQPQLAEDLLQAYVNTMRWYYLTHFQRYHNSLSKLKLYVTERKDLVGEDPSLTTRNAKASSASIGPTGFGSAAVPIHDPFNLSRRIDILRVPSSNALPSHAAEDATTPHYAETPFLSYNLALVDNASFEYAFLTAFLPPSLTKRSRLASVFHAILAPCLSLGQALTKSLTGESFDALGILLLVRLTQHFAFVLQRRKVPVLENYINGTTMELWPRFQTVIDAHCESMKRAGAAAPSRGGASSSALATLAGAGSGGSGAANGSGSSASTAPHPLTQRFASLTHSILMLSSAAIEQSIESTGPRSPATPVLSPTTSRAAASSEKIQRPPITTLSAPTAEPVSPALLRLRTEYLGFLNKAGQIFGPGERGRRERERWRKNNASLILAVLGDLGDSREGLIADVRRAFEELQDS